MGGPEGAGMDGGMLGEGVANMLGGPLLFAAGDIGGAPPPMGGGGIAG